MSDADYQWPDVTRAQLLAGLAATRDADQDDRFARLLHIHTTTEEDA